MYPDQFIDRRLPAYMLLLASALMILAGSVQAAPGPPQAPSAPTLFLPLMGDTLCATPAGSYCASNLPAGQSYDSASLAALNNHGLVVGTGYKSARPHAFLWRQSTLSELDLGELGAGGSMATDINDVGQVVGMAISGQTDERGRQIFRAFLWSNGATTDLGTLGGPSSNALAINTSGQVVGVADTSQRDVDGTYVQHAFLWENGLMTDLGTLGGRSSTAWDINDAGQVVGQSLTGDASPDTPSALGFLWHNGQMAGLTQLDLDTAAFDINSQGQAGGVAGSADERYAMLWQRGIPFTLGSGSPLAINDAGQLVGFAPGPTSSVAALWEHGEQINLNDLVALAPGWTLTSAAGINRRGQIIVAGLADDAPTVLLLTPRDRG